MPGEHLAQGIPQVQHDVVLALGEGRLPVGAILGGERLGQLLRDRRVLGIYTGHRAEHVAQLRCYSRVGFDRVFDQIGDVIAVLLARDGVHVYFFEPCPSVRFGLLTFVEVEVAPHRAHNVHTDVAYIGRADGVEARAFEDVEHGVAQHHVAQVAHVHGLVGVEVSVLDHHPLAPGGPAAVLLPLS